MGFPLACPIFLVGFLVICYELPQALLSFPLVVVCCFPVDVFLAASWLNHRFYLLSRCVVPSDGSRSGSCFSSPPGSGHYAPKPLGGASPLFRALH